MLDSELVLRDQIKELVRAKKYDAVDEIWLQVVEGDQMSLDFHESIVRFFLNKGERERLEGMYTLLLNQRTEQGKAELAAEVAQILLTMDPSAEFLREPLVAALRVVYADRGAERLEDIFRISGLTSSASNLLAAYQRFEELSGAAKGQVFLHRQWGLGIVRELDANQGWAVLDFAKKPNHRMNLEGIKNYLERIPSDQVLARVAKDPEGFKKEIFEDPSAAARLALRGVRGNKMKAADLKRLFTTQGFLTEADYKRWWNKAKDAVRRDPFIDVTGVGANQVLALRKEPRSFLDEMITKLVTADGLEETRRILRDLAKKGDGEIGADDQGALYQLFWKAIDDGRVRKPTLHAAYGVLFEEFPALFGPDARNKVDVAALLKGSPHRPAEFIADAEVFEIQRGLLERMAGEDDERLAELSHEVILSADGKLASWIEKTLAAKGLPEARAHCIERILSHPRQNIELFLWAARNIFEGNFSELTEGLHPIMICEELVSLLDELEEQQIKSATTDATEARAAATRVRTLLQESQLKHVKKAVRAAQPEEARKFLAQAKLSRGLTSQLLESVEQVVYQEHPTLRRTSKAEEEDERRRPAYHYATAESVDRKRQELSNILNVDIPENSKAIGTARELGDLKENAEYHAAKDRQKLLMQQATELEDLIARARVVDAEEVRCDQVRFGTRFTLLNTAEGREETYTLLGMWEANSDRNIVSYLTPFGAQVMGKAAGESFTLASPDGRTVAYKVVSIEKAL